MKTKLFHLIGTNGKRVVIIAPENIEFPSKYVHDFSSHCGAGKGFGDIIVPETVYGLKISPACFVHDVMWEMAEPTWEAFHSSNAIFLRNIISLIIVQSDSRFLKFLRMYRAVTYYNAVDYIGQSIFWAEKKKQADEIVGISV